MVDSGPVHGSGNPSVASHSGSSSTVLEIQMSRSNRFARANRLLRDICISSTVELLPEWEATLGLPDPCTGPLSTVQARRAQAVARFANTGGQSAAHFIRMAAQLGYAISITCYAPF